MTTNPHLVFFQDHAGDLEQSQRVVLGSILENYHSSDYARSIGEAAINNAEVYARQVPLVGYEQLRPWIERIGGHSNSLTADRTIAFFQTSGSTSNPKLIPVTPSLMRQKVTAFAIFWGLIYQDYPDIATGRLVSNFVDAGQAAVDDAGIEVCSESNFWSRRGRSINSMQRWPLPAELRLVKDLNARLYAVARLLMQSDLHCIMCLNPSTLLQFCRVIETHGPALIEGLNTGTWGTSDARIVEPLDVAGKVSLQSYLRTDKAAAARLGEQMSSLPKPRLSGIWPMLKLIVCWQSTLVKPYFEQLEDYTAGLPIRDYISQSSECMMAIPLSDSVSGGALAYTSHFFEFINECDTALPQPETRFAWQLEKGERYELVVSTGGGLYRYRTGDCIQVNGYYKEVPVIEFLYRLGKTSSITGEKLTEQHVLQAAETATAYTNVTPVEYLCFPINGQDPHYGLLMDWGVQDADSQAAQWCEAFHTGLQQANSEYADKCGSGRLGPIVAYLTDEGILRTTRMKNKAEGVSDEQVKSEVLTSRLDCHKAVNSARLLNPDS